LPLSTSIMAVMVLFYGVTRWNAWFDAMIYLRNRNLYPLQLFLQEILTRNSTSQISGVTTKTDKVMVQVTIKYATIMVVTLPIIFIYPFVQKYFVTGIMVGALKE
jgi:putative aldouronate transport system permease protein